MKQIIVCDSGLGGLNIAARFFSDPQAEPCELLYFNAYPAWGHGFNTLPDDHAKEELFREVLQSMEKFAPERCLVACNTLSIIYESLRKRYTPSFPVETIIDDAVKGMEQALLADPESSLLILGTKTTVESGMYAKRLLQKGFSAGRIRGLACPGLATMLETDPASPEVRSRIQQYARDAASLFPAKPGKMLLALCCTHFEFASSLWLEMFSGVFSRNVALINPNERMRTGLYAKKFRYLSRIGFADGAREKMVRYFENRIPEVASALAEAQPDSSLFAFSEQIKDQ